MNRSSQRGVALVITLIMLAVVTMTAVAFLAVARRERGSVSAAGDQLDAQFAADTALQRAEAEVAARIIASGSRLNFGLAVSTNWQHPQPDLAQLDRLAGESLATDDLRVFTNAAPYTLGNGQPYFNLNNASDLQRYRASLGNLFYDPRPPVFVATNRVPTAAPEFRFYLDLNRNGAFDSNGLQRVLGQQGQNLGTNTLTGDPEWVGSTEHPGLPHGPTNRFVSRWAYLILPAGRTLDLNYIHNDTKDRRNNGDGFMRNQGVGTFEGNLAAYLADLNTNVWPASTYTYRTALAQPSAGLAFTDADRLFQYRRGNPLQARADAFFERPTPFGIDHIDNFADGPLPTTLAEVRRPQDTIFAGAGGGEDTVSRRWPGTDNQRQYFDMTRLLDGTLGGNLENRLSGRRTTTGVVLSSTYDRTTFYRLLASLGTDTGDGRYESGVNPAGAFYRRARLNLNYMPEGDPNSDTPASADVGRFREWTPIAWYTNAVHRLLLTEFTNGLPDYALLTNARTAHLGHGIAIHGTNIVRGVTNIYRWDAQVHRLMQVAANIYDASHAVSTARPGNPRAEVPSVFRPILYRQATNGTTLVRLAGFQEVTNSLAMARPWIDLDDPRQVARLPATPDVAAILAARQDFNAYGIPFVVGAKRGLGNFQEGFWQTRMDVTRRLRLVKSLPLNTLSRTNARPWEDPRFRAEAQYRFDVNNAFGMDAWNSYSTITNRLAVTLIATNYYEFAIIDENDSPNRVPRVFASGSRSASASIAAGKWSPQQFLTPLNTGFGTNFIYDQLQRILYPGNQTNSGYADVRVPAPRLTLAFTNRLVYVAVDQTGRLLDVVNLKSVLYETNVLRLLGARGTAGATGLRMNQFWNTNLYPGGGFLQQGLALQFDGSLGSDRNGRAIDIPNSLWNDAPGIRPAGQQNEFEKDGLYYFMFRGARRAGQQVTPQLQAQYGGVVAQAGFTPTASVSLTDRRQANDPLVHFTLEDLAPGAITSTAPEGYVEIKVPGRFPLRSNAEISFAIDQRSLSNHLGNRAKVVSAYAPWGVNADLGAAAPVPVDDPNSTAYDVAYKDSLVRRSDDWNFPTNKFPSVGWLGRVHRGTPWQTIYLKGIRPEAGTRSATDRFTGLKSWAAWSGHGGTQPTNDWNILDLFTSAVNDNGARGLLGVNNAERAAWSAVLSGVPVLTNSGNGLATRFVSPASPELQSIVDSINVARTQFPNGRFERVGQVFSAPGLGVGAIGNNQYALQFSPFVAPFTRSADASTRKMVVATVPDEVIEQIPQSTLSLLRADEPRVVVYAFGQALKPAPNSFVTRPGPFFGLCTNYVVTSEYATRTAVRFDGAPRSGQLHTVVEDHRVLPPEN
ncbi:MAG: hypothetical protein DVB31_02470 [Verrucomicrobia bacterium]|nr:MAG: hypothetical protein DVB31_02470 [Verrucomicrobiota bacterium]